MCRSCVTVIARPASTHTALVSQSLVGLCFAFLSIYQGEGACARADADAGAANQLRGAAAAFGAQAAAAAGAEHVARVLDTPARLGPPAAAAVRVAGA